MFEQIKQIGRDIKKGFKTGVKTQDELADIQYGERVQGSGGKQSKDKQVRKRYSHSVIPGLAGGYYEALANKGITGANPAQMTGAIGARLLTDVADDATRHTYWRFNHPQAIGDVIAEQVIGDRIYDYNSAQRAAIELAGVGIPYAASLGVHNLANIGELGRPKGFAQTYAAPGSEDRRETTNPAAEVVERFGLGRRGRPLKFETAQEDIPDLTKERYANYMNFLYNDRDSGVVPGALIGGLGTAAALGATRNRMKNVLGGAALAGGAGALLGSVGALKITPENLEGKPEALVAGFPVGTEAVGALVGGAGTVGTLLRNTKKLPKARYVAGMGALGAGTGILAGKLANRLLASNGQSDLPTTQEYGITSR